MNQLIGIVDAYLFARATAPIGEERVFARMTGAAADEARIQAAMPCAATCVAVLDAMLDDKTYLADESFGLVDIMAGPHLSTLATTPEGLDLLAPHARLRQWLGRLEARASFRETMSPD